METFSVYGNMWDCLSALYIYKYIIIFLKGSTLLDFLLFPFEKYRDLDIPIFNTGKHNASVVIWKGAGDAQ